MTVKKSKDNLNWKRKEQMALCGELVLGREGQKWREDEEEDVSSYWVTVRKIGDNGNWKNKQQMALCGELALGREGYKWREDEE